MSGKLNKVADADIDPKGKFKYILINVQDAGSKEEKCIVRGYKDCSYHIDILEKVEPEIQKLGLKATCLGGGRIRHDPDSKSIFIYGYSQGFGRADHQVTQEILKNNYKNYTDITWSNEGY